MTRQSAPDILRILSSEAVRSRADAPLAALMRDLSRFVWANAAGARLLGLGTGPLTDARRAAALPVPRQLGSAARALSDSGQARLVLRLPGRGLSSPLDAADLLVVGDRGEDAFVLLALPGDPSASTIDPAVRLLREAGGGNENGRLAILNADGSLAAVDPGFPLEWIGDLRRAITEFREGGADRALLDPEGARLAAARLAHGFVALRVEPAKDEPSIATGRTAAPSNHAPPRPAGFVPNRRAPFGRSWLPAPLAGLLSAWAAAPPRATAPEPAGAGTVPEAEGKTMPALSPQGAGPAAIEPESLAGPEAAEPVASPPAPAPLRTRLHSNWGAAPATAPEAAVEAEAEPPVEAASEIVPPTEVPLPPADETDDFDASIEPQAVPPVDQPDIQDETSMTEAAKVPDETTLDPPGLSDFRPRFDVGPVRFSWQIDAEGRFRALSPEFAATVGPRSAAVIGRPFAEIADSYGFDADGELGRLLARRETWSGRSIEWPVENSDRKVPVDLAALPTHGRDRAFDGFRGFGILRPGEWVEDPEAIGLIIGGHHVLDEEPEDAAAPQATPENENEAPLFPTPRREGGHDDLRAALMASSVFGRRTGGGHPAPEPTPAPLPVNEAAAPDKVIRLEERRRTGRTEGVLTPDEVDAFRAIGTTLAESPDAERLSQAVVEASERLRTTAADDEAAGDEETLALDLGDLEPVFSALPLPILVQMRETLVAANAEFLEMTGYESVSALSEAGGLAHLFAEPAKGAAPGALAIRRADGSLSAMRVHMQRASVRGRSCLVMSFSPDGTMAAPEAGTSTAEASVLDAAHRLAILDSTVDGLVVFDTANRIEAMDEAAHALFGIAPGDAAGRPFSSLFALESQKPLIGTLSGLWSVQAPATGFVEAREVVGRTAKGGFQPLMVRLGRLSGTRGWCAVMHQDGERDRIERDLLVAQRRAEAANIQKSRFLANVSHELRTPLNAIIGFADVMAAEAFGPIGSERYLEYLADIKRSGHHLLDLVNDLLDISKIEAGKLELDMRAIEINDLVAETVGLMQTEAQRARVIVRTNLPRSVPAVTADGRSIRQIALNLLANAVRFTPAGGQIVVSTSHSVSGEVILRVRDTGIGMSREEIEVALSPFGQVRPAERPGERRAGSEGSGLGLPLSKAIAEANGARFSIASTPGEGTVVEIAFPAERVAAE
ncbi:ATP-binding protein [Antarcticirhabdus aurantiaca]|uniref:ATP-binding protein n=1 Tax=Antarcticirhabdus aurantiaca TaxID=2606717 RepID=A0ACD4NRH3_9HYPH|nr:ATP-binding protein [Antarcticirhabdus aurantiaca]WAJ29297.1 ATP-binding protein [Jeongeuplla avenae]